MPEPVVMTPEEHAANAAKLRAEAARAEAEAAKFLAEKDESTAKARQAAATALEAELKAERASEVDRSRRASDEFHHLYRYDEQVTSTSVGACMEKLTEWHRLDPECDIEVIFSSPGGSIFDGMELFDFLRDLSNAGHHVTTGGTGMAASMAGILLQAGDHRWVSRENWVLIHRAAFFAMGQTQDIEDQVKLVNRIEKRIIDIFVTRSRGELTAQKIRRNWERRDWWLDSDECLALGLVDEVRGRLDV